MSRGHDDEVEATVAELLNFDADFNIALFDEVMTAYKPGEASGAIVEKFFAHEFAWRRVDSILEQSQVPIARIMSLQCLGSAIRTRWNTIDKAEREGIRDFIVNMVLKLSSDEKVMKAESKLMNVLNNVLIQIVKNDWPHSWSSFIPDIVENSKTSQSVCANNMAILKILSEEVFDYSKGQMTTEKTNTLKTSLNKEFALIYELCEFILNKSENAALLTSTLDTLLRFLHWIPVEYIFETKLIETLALKFFPVERFRLLTLKCLTEIGALSFSNNSNYDDYFVALFEAVMTRVQQDVADDLDLAEVYMQGNHTFCNYMRDLAIFITEFLKPHLALLESNSDMSRGALLASLNLLLRLSLIQEGSGDEIVIFNVCLDFFNDFLAKLYASEGHENKETAPAILLGRQHAPKESPRLEFYSDVLMGLRHVLISCMAKPEEVLVQVEDGEVKRETVRNTTAIALYMSMREALIYLTNLDANNTMDVMWRQLSSVAMSPDWNPHLLNRICWAIGSISRALTEQQEKTFLVRVVKDLLALVEKKTRKDQKAIVASNVMYVVGQYPRFLRLHWTFLETVLRKLFEFMGETHPGVQDMSVNTFLKIAVKCRKMILTQPSGGQPFIHYILKNLPTITGALEQNQLFIFYEAVGFILAAEPDSQRRQKLLTDLMVLPNQSWVQVIEEANSNIDVLWQSETMNFVDLILKTNNSVCSAMKGTFIVQLTNIYVEMLHVYKLYSDAISTKIKEEGEHVATSTAVRKMRTVKREILKLISVFVESPLPSDKKVILNEFLPRLVEPVLEDYASSVPQARDPEVLQMFTSFITTYKEDMMDHIGTILASTFPCTLSMIKDDLTDFPDHRVWFYKLLEAVVSYCFPSLLSIDSSEFEQVMEAVFWGIKHMDNVQERGLATVLEISLKFRQSDVATVFFKAFYVPVLNCILDVLTDTFHRAGFQRQVEVLSLYIGLVESGEILEPLWPEGQNFPNNQAFVRDYIGSLILSSFANLTSNQVSNLVDGLFSSYSDFPRFKTLVRDFLIQLKEFASSEDEEEGTKPNEAFFAEEQREQREKDQAFKASVPGLQYVGPNMDRRTDEDDGNGE